MNKRKIFLLLPFLFIGCGSNLSMNFHQDSIATQKAMANRAWDELDGKEITSTSMEKPLTSSDKREIKSSMKVSDEVPNWFYSIPQSSNYFYGAGSGETFEDAKNSALNQIASTISVTISSSFSKYESYTEDSQTKDFYKSLTNKINSEVKKINFTNVEIVDSVKVGDTIYLLVRVNKSILFKNIKREFDLINSKIEEQLESVKNSSNIEKLIVYNRISPLIEKAIYKLNLLKAVNPSFNISSYMKKYSEIIKEKLNLLHHITFNVEGDNLFAKKLIEAMNELDYQIGNSNVIIKIRPSIRKSKPMGMAVVRATIHIELLVNGRVLKSNSMEVKGLSDTFDEALSNAANNFKEKIKEIGINKFLGLE